MNDWKETPEYNKQEMEKLINDFEEVSMDFEMDHWNDAKRLKEAGIIPEINPESDSKRIYRVIDSDFYDVISILACPPSIYKENGEPDFHNPGEIGIELFNTKGTFKDTGRITSPEYNNQVIKEIIEADLSVDPVIKIKSIIQASDLSDEVKNGDIYFNLR